MRIFFFLVFLTQITVSDMIKPVNQFLQDRAKEFEQISDERKSQLKEISDYISDNISKGEQTKITFICTHNSRRSHLAQILTQASFDYFKIPNIQTYSGGTESTAFNERAVAAIKRAGFDVENPGGENPKYKVNWDDKKEAQICFSKKFTHEFNPQKDFAAVMVCSDADEACPFVPGASARFAIPYVDPKKADGTSNEAKVYDDKVKEIAREMMYMVSLLK